MKVPRLWICICSDDGSATPVQDEQEDARSESRQSEVSLMVWV